MQKWTIFIALLHLFHSLPTFSSSVLKCIKKYNRHNGFMWPGASSNDRQLFISAGHSDQQHFFFLGWTPRICVVLQGWVAFNQPASCSAGQHKSVVNTGTSFLTLHKVALWVKPEYPSGGVSIATARHSQHVKKVGSMSKQADISTYFAKRRKLDGKLAAWIMSLMIILCPDEAVIVWQYQPAGWFQILTDQCPDSDWHWPCNF
jgi:hypothetical protein